VLLSSFGDFITWKMLLEKSAAELEADPKYLQAALAHLEEINGYCKGSACRHRTLVEHFGQRFEAENCGACDICRAEVGHLPDSTIIAQKILSCVARVKEGFGIGYVLDVLHGEGTERILKARHDQLSTFGLLRDVSKTQIRDWIHQLLSQKLLDQVGGEYPVLKLNAESWAVMRSQRQVKLLERARRERKRRERETVSAAVDEASVLFEQLRRLRRQISQELQVPPYIIFTDTTLHDLARQRPTTRAGMLGVTGVGEIKLARFGDRFLEVIRRF
jgi:ATP-dependent DNA helicase RecQ